MSTLLVADEQDDVFTIRSRLTASTDKSFALVIPPENEALGRDVTMRLLSRYADALGVRIAIISEIPSIRMAAEAAGFGVFGSVDEYEQELSEGGDSEEPDEAEPAGFLPALVPWLLLALLVLGVIAGAYVLLPTATVTLTPRTETISGIAEIQVEQEPEERAADAPQAYARRVELQLEVEDRAPTTGFGGQEARSTGAAILANRNDKPVVVPKGTIVSTPRGVRFQTNFEVDLPAGIGRVLSVPITAVEPGESGNVASRQISQIEGVLQPLVSVTNDEPTIGGTMPSATVNARDQEALRDSSLERARAEALSALEQMVGGGDVLLRDTISIRLVEASFDRRPGDTAPELNVRVTARASALIAATSELDRAAARAWNPTLRSGFEHVPDTTHVRSIEKARVTEQGAVLEARVESLVVARVDQVRVAQVARWRTAREAEAELMRGFELAKRPVITFDQPWAQRAYRVYVQVAPVR